MPDETQLSGNSSLSLTGYGELSSSVSASTSITVSGFGWLAPYSGSSSLSLTSYGWLAPDSRLSGSATFSLSSFGWIAPDSRLSGSADFTQTSYGAADYVSAGYSYTVPEPERTVEIFDGTYEVPNNGTHILTRWEVEYTPLSILWGDLSFTLSSYGALDYVATNYDYTAPDAEHIAFYFDVAEPPNNGTHVLTRWEVPYAPDPILFGTSTVTLTSSGELTNTYHSCYEYEVPYNLHLYRDLADDYTPFNSGDRLFIDWDVVCNPPIYLYGEAPFSFEAFGLVGFALTGAATLAQSGAGELLIGVHVSGNAEFSLTGLGSIREPGLEMPTGSATFSLTGYGAADYIQSCASYAPSYHTQITRHITEDYELPNNGTHIFIRWSGPDCFNAMPLSGSCELNQGAYGALDYEQTCTTYIVPDAEHNYKDFIAGYELPNNGAHIFVRWEVECPVDLTLFGNSTIRQDGLGFLDYETYCTGYVLPPIDNIYVEYIEPYELPNNGSHILVRYTGYCPRDQIFGHADFTLSAKGSIVQADANDCYNYEPPEQEHIDEYFPGNFTLPSDGAHIYTNWATECFPDTTLWGDSQLSLTGFGYLSQNTILVGKPASFSLDAYLQWFTTVKVTGNATFSFLATGAFPACFHSDYDWQVQNNLETDIFFRSSPTGLYQTRLCVKWDHEYVPPAEGSIYVAGHYAFSTEDDAQIINNDQYTGDISGPLSTEYDDFDVSNEDKRFEHVGVDTFEYGLPSIENEDQFREFGTSLNTEYGPIEVDNYDQHIVPDSALTTLYGEIDLESFDQYVYVDGVDTYLAGTYDILNLNRTITIDEGPDGFEPGEFGIINVNAFVELLSSYEHTEYGVITVHNHNQYLYVGDDLLTLYGDTRIDNYILYADVEGVDSLEYDLPIIANRDVYPEVEGVTVTEYGTPGIYNEVQYTYPDGSVYTAYGSIVAYNEWQIITVSSFYDFGYGIPTIINEDQFMSPAGFDGYDTSVHYIENEDQFTLVESSTNDAEYGSIFIENFHRAIYPEEGRTFTEYGGIFQENTDQLASVPEGITHTEYYAYSVVNLDFFSDVTGVDSLELGSVTIFNLDQFIEVDGLDSLEYDLFGIYNLIQGVSLEGDTHTEYYSHTVENEDQYITAGDVDAFEPGEYEIENLNAYITVPDGADSLEYGPILVVNLDEFIAVEGDKQTEYGTPALHNTFQFVYHRGGDEETEYGVLNADNYIHYIDLPEGLDTLETDRWFEVKNLDAFIGVDGADVFESGWFDVVNEDKFIRVEPGYDAFEPGTPEIHNDSQFVVHDGTIQTLFDDPLVWNYETTVWVDGAYTFEYETHDILNADRTLFPDEFDSLEYDEFVIYNGDQFAEIDSYDQTLYDHPHIFNANQYVTEVTGLTHTEYGDLALYATDQFVSVNGFESLSTDLFTLVNLFKEFEPEGSDNTEFWPVTVWNYNTYAKLEGEKYTELGEPEIHNYEYHVEVWSENDSFEYGTPDIVNRDRFIEPKEFDRFEAGNSAIVNEDQFTEVEESTPTEYSEWGDFIVWNYETIALDRYGSEQTEFGDIEVWNYETQAYVYSYENNFFEPGSYEIINADRVVFLDGEDSALYGLTYIFNEDRFLEPEGTTQSEQGRPVVLNEYEYVDADIFDGTEYADPSIRNEDYFLTPTGVEFSEYEVDLEIVNQHRPITPEGFEDAEYYENTIFNSLQFVGGIGLSGNVQSLYGSDIVLFNSDFFVYPAWFDASEYGEVEIVNESRPIQIDGAKLDEYGWVHIHNVDNLTYVEGSDFIEYEPVTVYNYTRYVGGLDFTGNDFDEYGDVRIDNYIQFAGVEAVYSFGIGTPEVFNRDRVLAIEEGFDDLIPGELELTEGIRYLDFAEAYPLEVEPPIIFNTNQYVDVEDFESEGYEDDATIINESQILDYDTLDSLENDPPTIINANRAVEISGVELIGYGLSLVWNQEHVADVLEEDHTVYGAIIVKNHNSPMWVLGSDNLLTSPYDIRNLDQFLYLDGTESLAIGDSYIVNVDRFIGVEGSDQTQFGSTTIWNYEQNVYCEDGKTFEECYQWVDVYNVTGIVYHGLTESFDYGPIDIINADRDIVPEEIEESTEYEDPSVEKWVREVTPEEFDSTEYDELAIHNDLHLVDIPLVDDPQYEEPFIENLDYFTEVNGLDSLEPDINNYEFIKIYNNDQVFEIDATLNDFGTYGPLVVENYDRGVEVFGVPQFESINPAVVINNDSHIGAPDTGAGFFGPCDTAYGDIEILNLDTFHEVQGFDSLEYEEFIIENWVRGFRPYSYEYDEYGIGRIDNYKMYLGIEGTDCLDADYLGLEVWSPTQFVGDYLTGEGFKGLTHTQYGGEKYNGVSSGKGIVITQTPSYLYVGSSDFYEDGGIYSVTQWHQEAVIDYTEQLSTSTFTVGTQEFVEPFWGFTFETGLPKVIRYLEIIFGGWRAETEFGDVDVSDGQHIKQQDSLDSLVTENFYVSNLKRYVQPDSWDPQFISEPPIVWNQNKFLYFWEDVSTKPQTYYGENADLENVDQEPVVSSVDTFESDGWQVTVRNTCQGIDVLEADYTEFGDTWISNFERSLYSQGRDQLKFDDHTPWIVNIARLVEHGGEDSLVSDEPLVEAWDTYTTAYQVDHLEANTFTIGTDRDIFFEWYHAITNENDFGPVTCLFWEQETELEGIDSFQYSPLSADERWNLIKFQGENNPFTEYENPKIENANKTTEVSAVKIMFEMDLPAVTNFVQEPDLPTLDATQPGEIRIGDERDQFMEFGDTVPYTEYSVNKIQNELPDPVLPLDQFIRHPRDERFDGSLGVDAPEDPAPLTEYYDHKVEDNSVFPNGIESLSVGDISAVSNIITFYEITLFEVDYPRVTLFNREIQVQSYVDDSIALEAQWELEMENKGEISVSPQFIFISAPKHPLLNCNHDGNSKSGESEGCTNSPPEIQNQHRSITPNSIAAGYYRYPVYSSRDDKFDDPTIYNAGSHSQYMNVLLTEFTEFGWFVITPYTKRTYPGSIDSLETYEFEVSTPEEIIYPHDVELYPAEVSSLQVTTDTLVESTIRHVYPSDFMNTVYGDNHPLIYHYPRGFEVEEYDTMLLGEPWIAYDPQIKDIEMLESLEANWEDFGPRFKVAHEDNHIGVMGKDSLTPGLPRLRMPDPCWEK